jgi:hypothetical protein
VLRVSLACKVFLDHPQNYWVCWRGSHPSPVRVSNKQSMQKLESKNKSIKTRVRQSRLDVFWGWSKFSRCKKRKTKRKLKITRKGNKKSNLDHLFPGNGARKRGLLTINNYIKVRLWLASRQVSRRSLGTLLPSSGEPKVSNPWNKCVTQNLI